MYVYGFKIYMSLRQSMSGKEAVAWVNFNNLYQFSPQLTQYSLAILKSGCSLKTHLS